MEVRTLGREGLAVSALGLGCMGTSDFYEAPDEAESIATIHRALELGVTFLDTADMYGPFTNEALVGRAIRDRRRRVVRRMNTPPSNGSPTPARCIGPPDPAAAESRHAHSGYGDSRLAGAYWSGSQTAPSKRPFGSAPRDGCMPPHRQIVLRPPPVADLA